MSEPQYVTARWTCEGMRLDAKGKRFWYWRTETGNELAFGGSSSHVAGAEYEVLYTVTDGRYTRHGDPVYKNRRGDVSEEEYKTWRMAERAAEQKLATLTRERNAKKQDELDEAMAPLLEWAKQCRTAAQRDALIAHVLYRLIRPWS